MFFRKCKYIEEERVLSLFAEGKITVYEFWDLFNSNESLRKVIINDKLLPVKKNPFLYDIDLHYLHHRCEVYRVVSNYFKRRKKKLEFYNYDTIIYSELLDVAPLYIDIDNEWFQKNILEVCPFSINTSERKKWIKEKINNSYIYEKKPPEWLQGPEWPIGIDGPLIFVRQTDKPDSMINNSIKYFFIDKCDEEIIIEQFD